MPVVTLQRLVSEPAAGVDHAPRFHPILDEGNQTPGQGVRNLLPAKAPDTSSIFLSRNDNEGFLLGLPTSHAFLRSAQVGFIDLHCPGQPIKHRPVIARREFARPSPGLFVIPQARQPVAYPRCWRRSFGRPRTTWPETTTAEAARVLDDRSRCNRGLMTAPRTRKARAARQIDDTRRAGLTGLTLFDGAKA